MTFTPALGITSTLFFSNFFCFFFVGTNLVSDIRKCVVTPPPGIVCPGGKDTYSRASKHVVNDHHVANIDGLAPCSNLE